MALQRKQLRRVESARHTKLHREEQDDSPDSAEAEHRARAVTVETRLVLEHADQFRRNQMDELPDGFGGLS